MRWKDEDETDNAARSGVFVVVAISGVKVSIKIST